MIFLRELRQHLRGSRGVLVDKNHHAAVKSALAEPFGDKRDGPLSGKFESQGQ